MSAPPNLSALSRPKLEALAVGVMAENVELKQLVSEQREEIARLKGLKGRPDIKPSGMEKATEPAKPGMEGQRPVRGKVRPRVAVEDQIIKLTAPAGSRFKGYETYQVQELVLRVRVVRYRRERWLTPDGKTIIAPLPEGTQGHFGPGHRIKSGGRPAPLRVDAVPSRPIHTAPSGGPAAVGGPVDLQA